MNRLPLPLPLPLEEECSTSGGGGVCIIVIVAEISPLKVLTSVAKSALHKPIHINSMNFSNFWYKALRCL